MKVTSPAGDFEINVKDADIEGDFVVLKGQIGIWDSRIYLSPRDLWRLTSILLRPAIVFFLLKLPLRLLSKRERNKAQ